MIQINLLPWRQLQREYNQTVLTWCFEIGATIGFLVALVFYLRAESILDDQTRAVQMLKDEVQACDRKIIEISKFKKIKEALIERMKMVQSLQSTRALTVHLFDELIKIVPDGVVLDNVSRVDNRIKVHGFAESNSAVSSLMRNIESNAWIRDPILTEIKRDSGAPKATDTFSYTSEFKLSFIVSPIQNEAKAP